jgi:hypothetical protein
MALKKDIILLDNFGESISFKDAILRVVSISGNKTNIDFDLGICRSQDLLQIDCMKFSFVPVINGENFIAQAYEYLKSMPEFAGAKDC